MIMLLYIIPCNFISVCFKMLSVHFILQLFGDVEAQFRRIMKMIAGGGLSITGAHTMCGDYLYSGHTVMLTLTYLFIKECKLLLS